MATRGKGVGSQRLWAFVTSGRTPASCQQTAPQPLWPPAPWTSASDRIATTANDTLVSRIVKTDPRSRSRLKSTRTRRCKSGGGSHRAGSHAIAIDLCILSLREGSFPSEPRHDQRLRLGRTSSVWAASARPAVRNGSRCDVWARENSSGAGKSGNLSG